MINACYCRVSKFSKSEAQQRREILTSIKARSNIHWYIDHDSTTEFDQMMTDIRNNKVSSVTVSSLDRLGDTFKTASNTIATLIERIDRFQSASEGVNVVMDGTSEASTLVLAMLTMENRILEINKQIGIEAAKKRGAFTGRKKGATKIPRERIQAMADMRKDGMTYEQIAKELGVSLRTVTRYLKALQNN